MDSSQSRIRSDRMVGWLYDQRGALAALPLLVAAFCTRGEAGNPLVVWSAGLALFVSGLAVRTWAQQHLHFLLKDVQNVLTRTGPYRLLRNPIYVGNTLICVGLTMLSRLLWLVPLTLVWCAVLYSLIVRLEERRLLALYGRQYEQYLEATPRWVPLSKRGPLELVNGFLGRAVRAELHNLLFLLPFILKNFLERSAR